MTRLLAALALVFLLAFPAGAQSWSANALVRVCPAAPGQTAPPDFTREGCETRPYWLADPQGRTLWIEAVIEIEAAPGPLSGPFGLYLSGKMAAQAWINGAPVGANGAPGVSAAQETPGLMDAALFVPAQLLQGGENRVVLLASGHHSVISLTAPVHRIAIAPYGDPRRAIVERYQASLVTLGVFALAFVFFALLAALSHRRTGPALLAALALVGGGQLIAEAGRGLFAYAYPVQDLRLLALAGGAALIAVCTAAWSAHRFAGPGARARMVLATGLGGGILAILVFTPGFDQKDAYTLIAGTLAAAIPAVLAAVRRRSPVPALWAAGFCLFAASAFVTPQSFLDRTVFWALCGLLLVNIAAEARRFAAERRARIGETRRADALASALARAEQASRPVQIALVSAGRTDYADAAAIARLNAADDYVEVVFKDGRTLLHTGALAKLEAELPASFLRVHRSCIVNIDEIEALERDAGGSGRLTLKTAGEAPVSRRILPRVRQALSGAPGGG